MEQCNCLTCELDRYDPSRGEQCAACRDGEEGCVCEEAS